MCEMQKLRLSVEQILTAAAEEIFGVFKRSIAEFEEKLGDSSKQNYRNRRRPDAEQQSECPQFIQNLWMVKEELHLDQLGRSSRLDQMDPELLHIKEEGNVWTNPEGEQFQGREEADITKFPSTAPSVKREYDEDEAQSSQFYHSQTEENTEEPEDGDDYGGSEPDSIQNNDILISDVACETTRHEYTEEDKTYMYSSVLETQMTDDTTKKPFSCSVCKKGFVQQCSLTQHMLIHTGEKPFSCSVCQKCFRHKSNLNQHMVIHTGEKPFRCSICHKCFMQQGNLTQHMLIHTGEKPFRCSVCQKCFGHKGNLNQHMVIHTGEKPFSCPICQKGFGHKGNLNQHMLIHTGEKPFCCPVCQKGFTQNSSLKKHMLMHDEDFFQAFSSQGGHSESNSHI